jgi:hypothetical protein
LTMKEGVEGMRDVAVPGLELSKIDAKAQKEAAAKSKKGKGGARHVLYVSAILATTRA